MGFSLYWSGPAALLCLLCIGEVQCICTGVNIQIEGGHYNLTKGLETGSLLVYHCPEGYYPHPELTRRCLPNQTWRPALKRFQPQRCRLVECPDPNVLENGNISPPQEKYFVGNETTFECFSGFTLRGSSRRVCLPNGKWSGSTPICSRDLMNDCADPGIPAGASRAGNMFGIDDKVTYTCNGNLFLVGSSVRVCQENGQWTGKEPACYYKYTYDSPVEVAEEFGRAITEKLAISEHDDDTEGNKKISKSRLNIYIAMDTSIEEKNVNNAKRTVKTLISKIASFPVVPNYEIMFFSSDVFEIVDILDFMDGQIQMSTIVEGLENFQAGNIKADGTDLNRVFTTFLEKMAIIKKKVGADDFKEHHHVLIIFTDGAYNMGGSPAPTVARIKNIVGGGGTQSRQDFLDIFIFAIGAEIFDEDLLPLTTGTGGRHYFRMRDMDNISDTFEEMIDEGDVLNPCGLHKENDTDLNKRKMYPWFASITIQHDGTVHNCLGSLVTPQFVLTAAHCFPFGVLPEHVTVEMDGGQGKVKRVKKFIIHPNFNISAKVDQGIKEFYDYDVALVQLEADVNISSSVRTICIPCTQETNNALRLVGVTTCKEQEQHLLQNLLERLSFLTKTGITVEKKQVSAKLGQIRDECITPALQAPGIATTNPKDVVTDNFLCTGGLNPHTDHIACKGDTGGAVFKNYEHRTLQVALVSWGTKDMCRDGGVVQSDATSRDFHINLFRVVPFLKSVLGDDNQDDYVPLKFLEN